MVHFWRLVTSLTCLITALVATPINQGQHVGGFERRNNKMTLFGHRRYPYMTLIKITIIKNDKPITNECGGVIIGANAVVTAAHCLYQKLNPKATIHAGIVHRDYEADAGQKREMKDFRIHERYRKDCKTTSNRYCYEVNDISIMWTEKKFEFGPSVQIATLPETQEKPLHREGWILGWGLNSNDEKPAILQMGQVKMMTNQKCANFDAYSYITENVICLTGVNRDVAASLGDSGGPFVIDGVVYGLCSHSIYSKSSPKKELSVYTFIPKYLKWIQRIVSEGPPNQKRSIFKPYRKP